MGWYSVFNIRPLKMVLPRARRFVQIEKTIVEIISKLRTPVSPTASRNKARQNEFFALSIIRKEQYFHFHRVRILVSLFPVRLPDINSDINRFFSPVTRRYATRYRKNDNKEEQAQDSFMVT